MIDELPCMLSSSFVPIRQGVEILHFVSGTTNMGMVVENEVVSVRGIVSSHTINPRYGSTSPPTPSIRSKFWQF